MSARPSRARSLIVAESERVAVDQDEICLIEDWRLRADATAIIREAAKKIGGGGGGRPNLAEAGGKNPDGLPEAYEIAKSEIASAIG